MALSRYIIDKLMQKQQQQTCCTSEVAVKCKILIFFPPSSKKLIKNCHFHSIQELHQFFFQLWGTSKKNANCSCLVRVSLASLSFSEVHLKKTATTTTTTTTSTTTSPFRCKFWHFSVVTKTSKCKKITKLSQFFLRQCLL